MGGGTALHFLLGGARVVRSVRGFGDVLLFVSAPARLSQPTQDQVKWCSPTLMETHLDLLIKHLLQQSFLPGPELALETSLDLYSFGVGDVNGEGPLDIVTSNTVGPGPMSGGIVTRLGNGKDAFGAPIPSASSLPSNPRVAALADLKR